LVVKMSDLMAVRLGEDLAATIAPSSVLARKKGESIAATGGGGH